MGVAKGSLSFEEMADVGEEIKAAVKAEPEDEALVKITDAVV
jgi:hypothetical protein